MEHLELKSWIYISMKKIYRPLVITLRYVLMSDVCLEVNNCYIAYQARNNTDFEKIQTHLEKSSFLPHEKLPRIILCYSGSKKYNTDIIR